MISTIAVLLVLAGAPQQADPAHAPAATQAQGPAESHAAPAAGAADAHAAEAQGAHGAAAEEGGHGGGNQIDFMHHIQDSREWELPFGATVHFPAKGSWMVGPIDMTPTKHVLFLALAALLTLIVLLSGARMAAGARAGRVKGKRHSAIEALVLFVRNEVVMPNVGHGGEKYAPFVITLFFFILFANLLGLIPYGSTATSNFSVTVSLAAMTMVVAEIGGLIAQGPKHYLKTLIVVPPGLHPVVGWAMAIFLFPIELMGKVARPFALAIRLMANMTAGHIVLLAITSLIFVFGSYVILPAPVLMGVAITFLEIFVSFLQAFIFAVLTSVFIGLVLHAH
jgi:F-type H+-transporting ATPase subunit a